MVKIKKSWVLLDQNGQAYKSPTPGQYGGHRKNKIYGRLNCPVALQVIAKGYYIKNRVFFPNEETAITAGFRPCSVCMKEKYLKWKVLHSKNK